MNDQNHQTVDLFAAAEAALLAAGISYAVVERCPIAGCALCSHPRLVHAA